MNNFMKKYEIEERELRRLQNNIAYAFAELTSTPIDVEAAKRCLDYANKQVKCLMEQDEYEGLNLIPFDSTKSLDLNEYWDEKGDK